MSEICFECFDKICNNKYKKNDYIISKKPDLCEECGKVKNDIIICEKKYYYKRKIFFHLKIYIIFIILFFIIKTLLDK